MVVKIIKDGNKSKNNKDYEILHKMMVKWW